MSVDLIKSLNDYKNLESQIQNKENILFDLVALESKKIIKNILKNGSFISYHYVTPVQLNIIFNQKYVFVGVRKKNDSHYVLVNEQNTNKKFLLPLSQYNLGENFVQYLKKFVNYLKKIEKITSVKYSNENIDNISFFDPKLFFSCCVYVIENYSYSKSGERFVVTLDLLKNIENSEIRNLNDLKNILESEQPSIYKAIFLYEKCFSLKNFIEDLNLSKYLNYYDEFTDYVNSNTSKNYFFLKVKDCFSLEHLHVYYCNIAIAAIKSFLENKNFNDKIEKDRNLKSSLNKAFFKSNFVGNVGEKIKINNCTVFKIYPYGSENEKSIVKVYDEKYNIYSFFIQSEKIKNLPLFSKIENLTGRIKRHRENDGVKENYLSFVRFKSNGKNNDVFDS